jgi:hypothetical protein
MSLQLSAAVSRATSPCIWMQAGVVKHKLCTMGYECTECHFDRALRRIASDNQRRRLRIPDEAGHRFRTKAATDSDRFRPPIPTQSGHPVIQISRS